MHTHILSMVCLKIGYLRINITLSHLITLRSLLDLGRKASLQKQLFYYFHHWWPASVVRNIWHIVLQGMTILPQKFSLSLIATIIKILLSDTLQVGDPLTALNSFFCFQPGTTQIFPKPCLSIFWGNLGGEGAVGLLLAGPRVLPHVATRGRSTVNWPWIGSVLAPPGMAAGSPSNPSIFQVFLGRSPEEPGGNIFCGQFAKLNYHVQLKNVKSLWLKG